MLGRHRPSLEEPVTGDAEGATLIGGVHEPEQELAAGEVEGGEAEFVAEHIGILCHRRVSDGVSLCRRVDGRPTPK